jgi:hypothetical protein
MTVCYTLHWGTPPVLAQISQQQLQSSMLHSVMPCLT